MSFFVFRSDNKVYRVAYDLFKLPGERGEVIMQSSVLQEFPFSMSQYQTSFSEDLYESIEVLA